MTLFLAPSTLVRYSTDGPLGPDSWGGNCDTQVRVEGTTAAAQPHNYQMTLNSGDAVFCSA